jgi:hypothetical protein
MRKVSPATFARQSLGIHRSHQGSRPGHICVETTGIGYSAGTLSFEYTVYITSQNGIL